MKQLLRAVPLLLAIFFILPAHLRAEGTKEVMPTAANGVALFINSGSSSGPYRGASSENRIRFSIFNNATENFYFGYRAYDRNGPTERTMYYRIVTSGGTQVVAPTLLATTAGTAGRITSYAQAVAGPNISGLNTAGYAPRVFDPTANGEYYIELYHSGDNGVTDDGEPILLTWFDFTVATAANVKYPGRVYSQGWSFITYNPSNLEGDAGFPLVASFYGLTGDSTIARIDYNTGFKPLAYVLYFNKYGVSNGGNWVADRKSVNTGATAPSLTNGYSVFLNNPDVTLFARSAVPATPLINKIYGCTGAYFVSYTISLPGDVAVLLDLNGTAGYQAGTADRYLYAYDVPAGINVIAWNGLNGLGAAVAATNVNATLYLKRGRTNLPMYDAELNQSGLTIAGLEPVAYNPRIYWDDVSLTSIGTTCNNTTATSYNNTTGTGIDNSVIGSLSPGRAWDGPGSGLAVPAPAGGSGSTTTNLCDDYGNARTLNTWFWTNEVPSATGSFALPDCDTDNDGIADNADLDDDNDGITDLIENGGANAAADTDADGIPNYLDGNFCTVNAWGICASMDADSDGVINSLDLDSDNDGIADIVEAFGVDTNGDGKVDYTGTWASNDSDGDGLINKYDTTTTGGVAIANGDTDGDGIKNIYDLDSDGDGIPDVVEGGGTDANNDGKLDATTDADGDGFADAVDGDAGNDGTAENTAAALIITGTDGNADGRPDTYSRANADAAGLPNPYDLDADGDGILDSREGGIADTDNNGIADGTLGTDGWSDTVDALSSLILPNTDGTGKANYLDIDSDDDGIVDNIEAQSTAGYTAPSGSDTDGDGIDNAYDNVDTAGTFGGNATNGLTPVNTDGADNPDYTDIDADNDLKSDTIEGWDTNGNGIINGTEKTGGAADADSDGLLDGWDANTALINPTNGTTPASYPDVANAGGDRDWRQAADRDSDGKADNTDVDDDNDGILDSVENNGLDAVGDADGDGILNYRDANFCTLNSAGVCSSLDADSDGLINAFDLDSDNDGAPDLQETGGIDTNGDGVIDNLTDTDGDGLANTYDTDNGGDPIQLLDLDGDGIRNYLDLDSDNDGIADVAEAGGVDVAGDGRLDNFTDTDGDGLHDAVDPDLGNDGIMENPARPFAVSGPDGNADGIPDYYAQSKANPDGDIFPNGFDLDSDNDGIADITEAGGTDADANGRVDFTGTFAANDTDGDGWLNAYDGDANNDGTAENTAAVLLTTGADANNDGRADSYPKANADGDNQPNPFDADADNDGVPDLVESGGVDSNGDGRIDAASDIDYNGWQGTYDPNTGGINIRALDANGTGVTGGSVFDFDGDGIANYLDLDSDGDGIPDIIEQGGTDSNNDGKLDASADADNDGFADSADPLNNSTGAALGTAFITTGSARDANNLPTTYSAGDNLDATGLINMLDLDADGDGILDTREGGIADADNNGIADGTLGTDGWSDTIDALATLTLPNTDNIGNPNYLDVDADNDGITDNIEGQSTAGYALPAGSDSDADGIDNAYDNNDALYAGAATNGITPNNHDGDSQPDYTDLDSDGDSDPDIIEGNDLNNSASADDIPTTVPSTDTDGDGLSDFFESSISGGPVVTIAGFGGGAGSGKSTAQKTPSAATNRDWRNAAFSLTAYTALPVKFLSVTAAAQTKGVLVGWSVAEEADVLQYIIERSSDGTSFTAVGTVAYKATTGAVNKYAFTDAASPGGVLYYRIRQVDMDGGYTVSAVVLVQVKSDASISVYPNPLQASSVLKVDALQEMNLRITITDMQGKTVCMQQQKLLPGRNLVSLDAAARLAAGQYLLVANFEGKQQVIKILK